MATVAPPTPPAAPHSHALKPGVQPLRAGQGNSFLWRKLHSLSGIVPIGAFLIEHIVSNFETVNGPLAYAKQVLFLNSLPLVRVLEWTFIFIPLAFHALYGVFIAFRGRSNINVYPWAGNRMYLSQRITGLIAFAYIMLSRLDAALQRRLAPRAPRRGLRQGPARTRQPLILAVYVIAMIATTWHFAYGIWLFAAKWGITPGDKARKKFGYVCAVVGIVLCLMGLASIYAVVTAPPAPEDVCQSNPRHVSESTPSVAPPGTTNPAQPGEVR